MAKSIRSKIKKKHRTEMRRTVGEPWRVACINKSQERLRKSLTTKTGAGLRALRGKLTATEEAAGVASAEGVVVPDEAAAPVAMMDEDAEEPSPKKDKGVGELIGKGHRGVFVNNGKGGRLAVRAQSERANSRRGPRKHRDRAGLGDKKHVITF